MGGSVLQAGWMSKPPQKKQMADPRRAREIIVMAGMEGGLASVVGGLQDQLFSRNDTVIIT